MKTRTWGTFFLLMTLLTTAAWAQRPGRMQAARSGERRAEFLKELQLTDAQKKDLGTIRFDARKQLIAQRAAMATARLDLRQLLRSPSPDKAAIEKKVREVSELRTKASLARVDRMFSIRNVLTPEQRSKVRDRIREAVHKRPMGSLRRRVPGPDIRERIKERMERFRDFDPFEN